MQKEIQLTDKTLLVVGLKKATYIAFIDKNELIVRMSYEFHQEQEEIKIPIGYELLGIYPELTEEQASQVVEQYREMKYPDYGNPYEIIYYDEDTALESFQSLMERENITGYDKYAILYKEK